MVMLKIFRATYVHRDESEYTPAAARQPFCVYELLYPKITVIIEKLRRKLKLDSIIDQIKKKKRETEDQRQPSVDIIH